MAKHKILTCGLNKRQRACADLYREDKCLNKSQAYRAIYPDCKKKNAGVCASQLFAKHKVKEYLAQFDVLNAQKVQVSVDGVISDLIDMKEKALGIKDMPMAKITKDGDIIQANVKNFDGAAAGKSLELLGKHLKMYTDKTQIDGALTVNLAMDLSGKRKPVVIDQVKDEQIEGSA